jgi:hypothetical protein
VNERYLEKHKRNSYRRYSLERMHSYINTEQEPKPTKQGIPPAYWPASGDLRVEQLSARYSPVRKNVAVLPFYPSNVPARVVRMDRRSFAMYPSISSLANVLVSVSAHKID